MANDIRHETQLIGFKEETTEGTFVAPADSDYIELLQDGPTVNKTRETKERDLLSGDRVAQDFRLSSKGVEVEIPVELKAHQTAGTAPAIQKFFEGFGMSNRGLSANVVSSDTTHTTTRIYIEAGDISKFKKNDIVKVLEAGKHHISPVSAVGANYIELLVAMESAPANEVEIAKSQVLVLDKTVNKSYSFRRVFEGGQVTEEGAGCKVGSIQLQNYTADEMPSLIIGMTGLRFWDTLQSPALAVAPTFETSQPPIVNKACVWKNSTKVTVSEFALSMEQTLTAKRSTCAEDGKVALRPTGKIQVTGTINPYKEQDAIGFTLDESEFSLFTRAFNPASTNGEWKQEIAFFVPRVKAQTIEVADNDGLLTDSVAFKMVADSEADSIVVAFF